MEYVTDSPIRPDDVYAQIGKDKSGSVLLHYAIVRQRTGDQVTTGIEFRAEGDAAAELAGIADEIRGKWDVDDVVLARRVGKLGIGDVIGLVAVSCPRSKDVFEASQFAVGRLKQMKTIQKTESYEDASA
ncbi:MAG: molybdenum cofactor biosynthesis protein MoaE [Planctomycetota bacterium]